ncbi:MAG: DUF99 family protein [Methanophagales archaeon ANME-1-THS]|nr:MAG: DUF99 family protein [Methanophagales archaeon ANME-1-THS]
MHVNKKGIRVVGIAESFRRELEKSVLAGIVMRSDFIIDGVGFNRITVGGMDATEGIVQLVESLHRDDINLMMLNGCVISWFNIVDLQKVYEQLRIPLICVTYEESKGLEEHITLHFEARERDVRIDAYKGLGERVPVKLYNHYDVLIRYLGIEKTEAELVLKKFTAHGRVPEPLRVARLMARALLRADNQFLG